MSSLIYKILSDDEWRAADRDGVFRGAGIDLGDGYIHFSTATQAQETAAKHFAGRGDLVLVAVEGARLGAALKWEISRGGQLFPHLYGPLATADALWVKPLALGPDGRHVFPSMV
jgi:uncharacterized protein (DUF952 family)